MRMKHLNGILCSLLMMGLLSCQQNQPKTSSTSSRATQAESSPLSSDNADEGTNTLAEQRSDTTEAVAVETHSSVRLREGTHAVSLQWISWEDLGSAHVEHIDGNRYRVEGEQRSDDGSDYLEISGVLEPLSDTALRFEGTIVHRVSHLNGGKPCVKEGKQLFLATKNRKYWRMQDMENCEGGRVTDYVDIYF